mmetsp:Transcript_3663/g.8377  ORF Transcript_3663/g.8377 Transcript_3663/m.8377 type:complete len:105 (+) Transcript_3663:165-479(+)
MPSEGTTANRDVAEIDDVILPESSYSGELLFMLVVSNKVSERLLYFVCHLQSVYRRKCKETPHLPREHRPWPATGLGEDQLSRVVTMVTRVSVILSESMEIHEV